MPPTLGTHSALPHWGPCPLFVSPLARCPRPSSSTILSTGAGFDAGAAAEEAKRRAGQAKQAAAGWLTRARGVLTAVGREVKEVILPKTGARRGPVGWMLLSP